MRSLARVRRIRSGETILAAGVIAVAVALTLSWYRRPGGSTVDAWGTFGVAVALLVIAAVAAVAAVAAALVERTPAAPVMAAVCCAWLGLVAVIAAVIRLLERPDGATGVCAGGWVALGGAIAILAGAWQTLRDERPGLYRPSEVPARPAPPT